MGARGWTGFWPLVGLLLVPAGCGSGSRDEADADVDGDTDVDTDSDSDSCEIASIATGCPCDALEPETCYEGPAETLDVGECHVGRRTCEEGRWSECIGQSLPAREICDYLDDDCDGEVDEDVRNECGTCGDCNPNCVGRGCAYPFDSEQGEDVIPCEGEPEGECLTLPAAPSTGRWGYVFTGCPGSGGFNSLWFEAELPEGATLEFEARAGDTFDDLSGEPWTPVGTAPPNEGPLELPRDFNEASFLEVLVRLTATGDAPPRLFQVTVVLKCGV